MQKNDCTSHEQLNIEERNKLVESNMKLVGFSIRKLGTYYKDDEDELQEGYLALIEAASSFDPSLGYEFSTYAVPYIMGKIRWYRDSKKYNVRPPRSLISALGRAWKVLESNPDILEIDLSDERCRDEMLKNGVDIVSLQKMINLKNSPSLYEVIRDTEDQMILDAIGDQDNRFSSFEMKEFIEYCLRKSFKGINIQSERNKDIVRSWIYLVVLGGYITQNRLSDTFDLSRQQIKNIIEKFKETFRREYLKVI